MFEEEFTLREPEEKSREQGSASDDDGKRRSVTTVGTTSVSQCGAFSQNVDSAAMHRQKPAMTHGTMSSQTNLECWLLVHRGWGNCAGACRGVRTHDEQATGEARATSDEEAPREEASRVEAHLDDCVNVAKRALDAEGASAGGTTC